LLDFPLLGQKQAKWLVDPSMMVDAESREDQSLLVNGNDDDEYNRGRSVRFDVDHDSDDENVDYSSDGGGGSSGRHGRQVRFETPKVTAFQTGAGSVKKGLRQVIQENRSTYFKHLPTNVPGMLVANDIFREKILTIFLKRYGCC
jgi:hypothetical protein